MQQIIIAENGMNGAHSTFSIVYETTACQILCALLAFIALSATRLLDISTKIKMVMNKYWKYHNTISNPITIFNSHGRINKRIQESKDWISFFISTCLIIYSLTFFTKSKKTDKCVM